MYAKHSKFIWSLSKTFEKYRVVTELKSISFIPKIFKTYQNSISDCVILVQKTREILNFYAKHSIEVVFCKEKILGTSDSQNIQKVHYFNTKDSICITFVHKAFEKYVISSRNIRKVLNFYAKQSNGFILVIQLLEKYLFLILSQNI